MTCEEVAKWMATIHDDIRDAYIQDDLFWQFQDMIRENERLANSQSVFLYWVNMLFKDSIVMAVRRQIDRDEKSISLRRLLTKLQADPGTAGNRFTAADLQTDMDDLDRSAKLIRAFADRRIAIVHLGEQVCRSVMRTCIDSATAGMRERVAGDIHISMVGSRPSLTRTEVGRACSVKAFYEWCVIRP